MASFTSTSRRMLIAALALLAAAAAALLVARDQPADAASTHTVKLSADGQGKLKFNKTKLTTTHGKVTLVMTNPSGSGKPHGVAVEGHGVDKDGKTVSPGGASRVTATLKKGTYEFYCPVDGHKAAGMEGKLVVK
ncbi:MAG TPA: plastocyanin/azurin family copper-binding protein [Baekduia sp.]|uniref:plastocyanin/azurin family copper-binding protein n=1 Tax=Baekduia sp. TaxID=2600305 RepID=UPI002B9AD8A2|nr:plastocyanin/azurin family copper-binding protein [Baekduia sp.]HMJ32924.1 plastocyanin/azurin family copper-binding protein [Baekduia sp.]